MNNNGFPFQRVSLKDLEDNITSNGKLTALMDVCGFFLCQQGWAKVTLGEKSYVIRKGDIYLYTPSAYLSLQERSEDLEGIIIKTSLDQIYPYLENSINTQSLLLLREKPYLTLSEEQLKRIHEMSAMLEERQERFTTLPVQSPARPILYKQILNLVEAYINELMYDYSCGDETVPETQDNKDKVFQNFMISLLKNYKKEREVTYYAQEQFLSPRYFSSVIKQKTGHSASQWIVEIVISNSSQMLAHTDKSIKEIAMEYNFPTQSFFGKYFKQYTGVSPKEYRQRHRF